MQQKAICRPCGHEERKKYRCPVQRQASRTLKLITQREERDTEKTNHERQNAISRIEQIHNQPEHTPCTQGDTPMPDDVRLHGRTEQRNHPAAGGVVTDVSGATCTLAGLLICTVALDTVAASTAFETTARASDATLPRILLELPAGAITELLAAWMAV